MAAVALTCRLWSCSRCRPVQINLGEEEEEETRSFYFFSQFDVSQLINQLLVVRC